MTTTTIPHDSHTCSLNAGGPCAMCSAANDYEQRQSLQLTELEFVALATPVLERVREELGEGERLTELRKLDSDHAQRILAAIENDKRFASLTTIRAAIADVVDGAEFYQWMWDKDEDNANAVRQEFMDAVAQRIAQLQSAPHNFDPQYHDYCTGYATGWADAHTETLRLQNEDLREMLRGGE